MWPLTFQSAPLTEARGDPSGLVYIDTCFEVSIRSPHRSKGRLVCCRVLGLIGDVSIRSPHRSKGRQELNRLSDCEARFQSAPLTEARGDRHLPLFRLIQHCFNPLPSPKQGETMFNLERVGTDEVFQSAPLTEARGDPTDPAEALSVSWFQSAPLTEARGDIVKKR